MSTPELCDWCAKPATKSIENWRGYGYAVACDWHVKYAIRYVLPINDPRCGDRHDEDGEGGVNVPAGDSPDSPPAGESRLPGEGGNVVTLDASADYARVPDWPIVPECVTSESGESFALWMGPDGAWHSETVPAGAENSEA